MQDVDAILQTLQTRVDSILQKLDKGGDIKKIRGEIADLIFEHLQLVQKSLGYWEKMYFAYAINALAWNINSSHEPSWLRLCLVSLEKAFIPAAERNEKYSRLEKQIDTMTYVQLMEGIESIRSRLPTFTP
jgi:hypothetical protein